MSGLVEVTPFECWQLLERAEAIARVVWSGPEGPAIAPVNYVVADGALWFQTAAGSRLATEAVDQQVLVEVDAVDMGSRSGWSVVVSGRAVRVLGRVPEMLGGLDVWPAGPHPVFVRIEPDRVTGRRVGAGGA